MIGFEAIKGQEQPVRILTTFLRKQIIPHALLFTGIDGIGKRTTALSFAMACNCMESRLDLAIACEQCKSCRKILSDNHPDIIMVKPSGNFIRIDQVRDIGTILSLKPFEAKTRVVILSDAQTMNPESSNALLKLLEEPPDRTILILTALAVSDLLPTIVSRCQSIPFHPIPDSIIEESLVKEHQVEPEHAMILASLADGSFSKALIMASSINRINWISRRNWIINALGLDQTKRSSSGTFNSLFAFSEQLSSHKDMVQDTLELIKTWLRDLIVFRYNPEKIINKDLKSTIQNMPHDTPVNSLISKIYAVQAAQRNIHANSNLRLTIDVLVTKLAGR